MGNEPQEPQAPPEIIDATVTPAKNEIVDVKGGEIIPRGANTEIASTGANLEMIKMEQIGTLAVSEEAMKILEEPLKPEDVRIRPNDGIVYLPWTYYAERLNRAFGKFAWGLIPAGMPMSQPNGPKQVLVVWGHWLVVRGTPIGFAIGECNYVPANAKMTYADACEGAKSNALARNCKLLGMTLELWDHDWGENWKRQYATKVNNDWVKKSSIPAAAVKKEANKTAEPALVLSGVKREWMAAAIKKGIMLNEHDKAGGNVLATLLGELYTGLTMENAANNRGEGIKRIEAWVAPVKTP
jgi:hypothetical protein